MTAYKFDTEQQAQEAIDKINAYFGIPTSEDAITRTYTNFYEKDGFFWINWFEGIDEIDLQPNE
jgi:hypothetical protein